MQAMCLLTGALALASLAASTTAALAAAADYRFDVAGKPQPHAGGKELVQVRLLHLPDGRPVTDAVIFESRADMGPAGMAGMSAPVQAAPVKDGLYGFVVEPGMAGAWALHLAAKVQGEAETVRGTVSVELVK